ncbi:MAG: endopeptidase La [Lachnospiraceae bacterium]|nr:endopeptidase La [Lachnospiraceae bacterium]
MLVIPSYNKIILPDAEVYFQADQFRGVAGRSFAVGEKVVLLILKEDQTKEQWTEDSFYPIGVAGVIGEVSEQGYVSVITQNRVDITHVSINPDRSIDLTISRRDDIQDLDEAASYQKLQALKKEVIDLTANTQFAEFIRQFVEPMNSIATLACGLSPWLTASSEERYAVLAEDSANARSEKLAQMLYEYFEVTRISGEANASQQKEYQDQYREAAIRKQMQYLQKELDSMHPENVTDVQKFEKKIAESGMNETARKEAEKVLNRLRQEGQESQEYGMLYDYLDFVTSLSWKAEPPKFVNLDEAQKVLDEDHYGLKKVKQRIIQQIAVMNLKKQQTGSILLFVGAPGTGKTSIGKSIARALGRKYVRVSLGGVRDEADIRGHRRTYIGAMPGRIMDGIEKSGVSNPVMVLDEVDKLSQSYNGDPASALLEVLDPEQNNTFTDHYMNVPYDLSNVMFICTANSTDTIPAPLLNRMEVIQFTGYTPEEKLQIAKKHLVPKAEESMGIPDGRLVIPDDTLREIISEYTMEAGVRGLRKRIDTLCRNAAVKIAQEMPATKSEQAIAEQTAAGEKTDAAAASAHVDIPESDGILTVTKDQLRSLLDMHPVHHDRVLAQAKPGVVTGLAWTEVGGEILYIETLFTKGKGETVMTGQLGDVMKESAEIAVDLVKSLFPDKADLFAENDLHIHVPEGAVKKDGPSAGITLTTAISSLVTGIAVDPHVAMTGEVSLRGAVMPIGGLPEKLMAAQRAGVTHVFIPRENMEDLDEVADDVKKKLTITPVDNVTDVLKALHIIN